MCFPPFLQERDNVRTEEFAASDKVPSWRYLHGANAQVMMKKKMVMVMMCLVTCCGRAKDSRGKACFTPEFSNEFRHEPITHTLLGW
jgi:hypothetical protein